MSPFLKVALATPLVALALMAPSAQGDHHSHNGNILISDQFNNRVIEVDHTGKIVWSFGNGSSTPGPHSIVGPNDAERIGSWTLISGTGAPAGAEPTCPSGCADNRVILVNEAGKIIWQYGQDNGATGTDDNFLNTPVCSVYLPNGHILITDQVNERVIEVNQHKHIVWQYGTNGVMGAGDNQLNNPNSAELLENGNILIADENNNRVIEVTRQKKIAWSYGSPTDTTTLNGAAFASRLENGNTVITDSNNNRIVEVDLGGHQLGMYPCNTQPGSIANPLPTRALKLQNGDMLVSNQFDNQVFQVDSVNATIFSMGTIGASGAGNGPGQLNAPYDAKVIGDFTGITPPFGRRE